MSIKKVLLLTDFSELSEYARSLADKVASSIGAELHLLKIVDIPSEIELSKDGELLDSMGNDLEEFVKEKAASEAKLQTIASSIKAKCTCRVMYGRLLSSVQTYVADNKIDLLVMGTHGTSGMRELLSGSVTEHVIKTDKVPVLSLKCDRENMDFSDFLITGDFEDKVYEDLAVLKDLQKVFHSTMHLLWVNTDKAFASTSEATKKMKAFAERNGLTQVEFHHYADKSIEQGIVNFSNNYDATHDLDIDIIAVEKKEKTQLGYVLTGCQATSFVNHIFRPIVTYRNN